MSSKPFISIITATYNSAKTFQETIDSIRKQPYKNFEYIVIDANSNDGTVDIIKNNLDIISKWISEPDKGIYDAWNKGINLASGDWISFIGSDDTFKEDALESYVKHIDLHKDKDLLYVSSKIEMVNGNGKILRVLGWPWEWKLFRRISTVAHPGSMHSKKLFEQYGSFDLAYKICGDYELLLRPQDKLRYSFLNKITLSMFDGGASSNSKMYKEHLRAVLKHSGITKAEAYRGYIWQVFKQQLKNYLKNFNLNVNLRREYKN